jgi:hypothetical protein
MMDVTPGSVVLIGFPHDEGAKRSGIPAGSATGPAAIRFYLRKLLASTTNPEFGIDLSRLQILDVGDVPLGLTLEDALSRLDDSIIDVIQRGGLPIVLGGSGDLAYACASGLMTACGVPIAVVDINSSLNMDPLVPSPSPPHLTSLLLPSPSSPIPQRIEQKVEVASTNRLLLNDARFCPPKDTSANGTGYYEPHCEGRFVIYGAQVRILSLFFTTAPHLHLCLSLSLSISLSLPLSLHLSVSLSLSLSVSLSLSASAGNSLCPRGR